MRRDLVTIPQSTISRAEGVLAEHLDSYASDERSGLEKIGGSKWWRVRGRELEGEWIEVSPQHPPLSLISDGILSALPNS